MNKKKTVLILILVFVLLLGGASILYTRLGQTFSAQQLAVQVTDPPTEEPPTPPAAETEAATEAVTEPRKEPVMAPDFTVYDAQGNPAHLYDYLGKPIVLNFWASWCGPCQMEMPDFQEKYQALGEDVQFLMVNMTDGARETVDTATDFISRQGYTFPVLYDTTTEAAMTYGAYSLPMTFFIGAEGEAIARATGAIDGETLQRGIDMILEPSV